MPSIVTTNDWSSNIGPVIKKGFRFGWQRIPEEVSLFYTRMNSNKESEKLMSYGDTGAMGQFTGSLDFDTVQENYTKTVTAYEFAKGMGIQRKLVLTDQVRAMEEVAKAGGRSAQRRFLSDAYSWLINAFNTTLTVQNGEALCASSHSSNVGGTAQGNAGTSALSPANVDATRILMLRFNTNTDQVQFESNPDTLIVPLELEAYAEEIVKSKGKVDVLNNNINFHHGKYKVIATRMLVDANNWFMVDSAKMKDNNCWFDVQKLQLEKDLDFSTKVSRYSAYTYYGFGALDYQHIYGNNVS